MSRIRRASELAEDDFDRLLDLLMELRPLAPGSSIKRRMSFLRRSTKCDEWLADYPPDEDPRTSVTILVYHPKAMDILPPECREGFTLLGAILHRGVLEHQAGPDICRSIVALVVRYELIDLSTARISREFKIVMESIEQL